MDADRYYFPFLVLVLPAAGAAALPAAAYAEEEERVTAGEASSLVFVVGHMPAGKRRRLARDVGRRQGEAGRRTGSYLAP